MPEEKKDNRGGVRPGAGRPPGVRNWNTQMKEEMLNEIRGRTKDATFSLIHAQMTLAMGFCTLWKIEKEKQVGPKGGVKWIPQKPERVTSVEEMEKFLELEIRDESVDKDEGPGATYYYLVQTPPNNQALDSLLDRTLGTAVKVTEVTGKDGAPLVEDASKELIEDMAKKINEVHSRPGVSSDGVVAYTLDIETSDKERVGSADRIQEP